MSIPVLVNTKPLVAGEELKVFWTPVSVRKTEKRQPVTWASQAREKIGKQQQQQKMK